MKLEKCSNGHFYDADLSSTCPHCVGTNEPDSATVALDSQVGEMNTTVAISPDVIADTAGADKTLAYLENKLGTDVHPVVGWLVCIKGKHLGEDFRLKAGRNFIGRSSDMDVSIAKDNSVSRDRHAIVVYDPKGNTFIVQPGEARELCYLNGAPVYTAQDLKLGDNLLMGETTLMFIPCCSQNFTWETDNTKDGEKA